MHCSCLHKLHASPGTLHCSLGREPKPTELRDTCATQTTRDPSESCMTSWGTPPAPPASTDPARLWKQPHHRMDTSEERTPPHSKRTELHPLQLDKACNFTIYSLPLQNLHWECCLFLFASLEIEDKEEGRTSEPSDTRIRERNTHDLMQRPFLQWLSGESQ